MQLIFNSKVIGNPMKKSTLAMIGAILILLFGLMSGCGEDSVSDYIPDSGGGGGFVLTVGSGVNPTYTWTGGVINSLFVQIVGPWTTVWQISYYDSYPLILGDGIVSPVTHGTKPADTNVYEIISIEPTLTGGTLYRAMICNQAFDCDFQDFTP